MTNLPNKSNLLNNKLLSKTNIAIVCLLAMLMGFFLSRAVMSISMIALGVIIIFTSNPKLWIKNRYWILGAIWVGFYILSLFWSEEKTFWWRRVEVKMPILLIPAVFCCLPAFTVRQLRFFTITTGIVLLLSTIYTLKYLYFDTANLVEQYRFAKVLPTLAHDHIRYSLLIALFIVWSLFVWRHLSKPQRIFVAIADVLLAIFLHILAVRTGLLALYLFVIIYAFYKMFGSGLVLGLVILGLIGVAGVVSYKYVPTVRNKVDYVVYSAKMYEKGEHTGNYSDIGRVLSYEIAWDIIKDNKLKGVGAGEMMQEMDKGYTRMHPYVIQPDRKMPHNQFLCVALGCGLIALLFFTLWMFEPLTSVRLGRDGFFLFSVWMILFALMNVEPMLEIQKGIFAHLFFLLMMRHVIKHKVA